MQFKYPHFSAMHSVGNHAMHCLFDLYKVIEPGISSAYIDKCIREYANQHRLTSATFGKRIGTRRYPSHCCVSINEEVCHAPTNINKVLCDGDLVKVDVVFKDSEGWHGDACLTYFVGQGLKDPPKLLTTAHLACNEGIRAVKVGEPVVVIGKAIEKFVKSKGFSVVEDYCGHSIGKRLHGNLIIPHFYIPEHPASSVIMKPGMMFTIEPMINEGGPEVELWKDGWTIRTKDLSRSAQFEHTIGIDKDESIVIFTRL